MNSTCLNFDEFEVHVLNGGKGASFNAEKYPWTKIISKLLIIVLFIYVLLAVFPTLLTFIIKKGLGYESCECFAKKDQRQEIKELDQNDVLKSTEIVGAGD
jgi:hypothetical protein